MKISVPYKPYETELPSIANPDHFVETASAYIETYWNGEASSPNRAFRCTLAWSEVGLSVVFDAKQQDAIVASPEPNIESKTIGLWERDVCEIFIAPDRNEPRRYFEFEVAPTGEWLDLAIDLTSGERVTDWEYDSGVEAAARIEDGRVLLAMRMPWAAFGKRPEPGDVWLGNIFRCIGKEPDRGYLAWRPTMTETPNFHVPEAFGELRFV